MSRKAPDWSLMPAIIKLLERLEAHLEKLEVHDNQRCQGLWLKLYPDGSGEVMNDYSKASPEESEEQRLVRTVMTTESMDMVHFDSLEELHGELIAQTMRISG